MIPHAKKHRPTVKYLRRLIEQTKLSQEQVAKVLGVRVRTLARWISYEDKKPTRAPYTAQYTLEMLAANIKEFRRENDLVLFKGKTISREEYENILNEGD